MKWSPRTWFLLSMLLFTGAWVSWQKGDEIQRRKHPIVPTPPGTISSNPVTPNTVQQRISLRSTSGLTNQPAVAATGAVDPYPLRLKNTAKTVGQLIGSDRAVLLRNALFDTSEASEAPIPDSLKSKGDPGSYVVQAKSIISRQFREALASAGARIVSYVPNNAFLVRMSETTAQTLRGDETVQAIVAYEPYYKLDFGLLKLVVKEEPLPADAWVRVGLFPDTEQSAREAIEQLGGFVGGSDPSPFGPELLVQPKPDSLAALARLPQVQNMERARVRKPANDLTRVQTGVSEDSITTNNHLSLSGSNIWVGVVDGGIDRDHPAIKGRVFGPPSPYIGSFFSGKDPAGHGTFVTATLIGSDEGDVGIALDGFQGSETNASFRGMAHGAKVFAMPFDYFPFPNRAPTDTYLQETAADTNYNVLNRKDTLISNNSWVYDGSYDYDSSAARYDSAVRDALPGQTGYQPVSYVFPVGNAGGGNDFGQAGEAMSIASPATAKNVISVGAIEHFRNITNGELATNIVEVFDGETNILQTNIVSVTPFKEIGDSQVEVASFSGRGNVGIGIEGDFGRFKPDVVAPGTVVVSAKSENWKLEYDFATNSLQYKALGELNSSLPDGFRVDSGTSFAAPAVSGMLALVQEFFEEKAPDALKIPKMSPALMKALLINSARSTGRRL